MRGPATFFSLVFIMWQGLLGPYEVPRTLQQPDHLFYLGEVSSLSPESFHERFNLFIDENMLVLQGHLEDEAVQSGASA